MIVMAILGILAAIAIPVYRGYVERSRSTVAFNNFDTAVNVVKYEFTKQAAGDRATTNILSLLNHSGANTPYNSNLNAFVLLPAAADGQVAFNVTDLCNLPVHQCIMIQVDWTGDGHWTADGNILIMKE